MKIETFQRGIHFEYDTNTKVLSMNIGGRLAAQVFNVPHDGIASQYALALSQVATVASAD